MQPAHSPGGQAKGPVEQTPASTPTAAWHCGQTWSWWQRRGSGGQGRGARRAAASSAGSDGSKGGGRAGAGQWADTGRPRGSGHQHGARQQQGDAAGLGAAAARGMEPPHLEAGARASGSGANLHPPAAGAGMWRQLELALQRFRNPRSVWGSLLLGAGVEAGQGQGWHRGGSWVCVGHTGAWRFGTTVHGGQGLGGCCGLRGALVPCYELGWWT